MSKRLFCPWPFPQEAEHSVRAPLLHTNGDWVSSGRSVRGGIRTFLLGAEPRAGCDLSCVHLSEDEEAYTEEDDNEEAGKEGFETGGAAGGGSSTDTVSGPRNKDKKKYTIKKEQGHKREEEMKVWKETEGEER